MSAPPAGKFQDHYVILNVDPKASAEALQAAHKKLVQKYHPDNPETGNEEKLEAVELAYEVLSDPSLRREFDKLKGLDLEAAAVQFSGAVFFTELGRSVDVRTAVLCVLYDRRRRKPYTPSLSMRNIENMLNASSEELNFALWYLKQRGFVSTDDKSSLQISVEGMDLLEANRPTQETIMPLVKAESIKAESTEAPESQPKKTPALPAAAGSNAVGSVRNALNNAISRR
jgi:curved DNA-binding protein CbpA